MKKMYKNIIEIIMLLVLAFIVLIYRITTKFKTHLIYIALGLTVFVYAGGVLPIDNMYISEVYAYGINNTSKNKIDIIDNNINNVIEDIFDNNTVNEIDVTITDDGVEDDVELNQYTPIILSQVEIPASRSIINREFNINKVIEVVEEEEDEIAVTWNNNIGNDIIETDTGVLVRCELPKDYGDYINITSFKPYMDYRLITNTRSAAYRVSHSELAYTDEKGFRRFQITDNNFTLSNDDYIIALGSAFTKGGIEGQRFLIIGEYGMYTAKIGDHKSDLHTDSKNMYSLHGVNKQYGGLLEFVVNSTTLEGSIKNSGSVNSSSVPELTGDIISIYRIDDNIN